MLKTTQTLSTQERETDQDMGTLEEKETDQMSESGLLTIASLHSVKAHRSRELQGTDPHLREIEKIGELTLEATTHNTLELLLLGHPGKQ